MRTKVIQETGTPALLCFEPEEPPTGCHITSFIKVIEKSKLNQYINLSIKLNVYVSK